MILKKRCEKKLSFLETFAYCNLTFHLFLVLMLSAVIFLVDYFFNLKNIICWFEATFKKSSSTILIMVYEMQTEFKTTFKAFYCLFSQCDITVTSLDFAIWVNKCIISLKLQIISAWCVSRWQVRDLQCSCFCDVSSLPEMVDLLR